ncbi:hypothetical protein DDE05_60875 [Streptomyces cavourensis]|nr:hypothetical protein DDE05_60875 [Streptomyces cavourensis]
MPDGAEFDTGTPDEEAERLTTARRRRLSPMSVSGVSTSPSVWSIRVSPSRRTALNEMRGGKASVT